MDVALTFFQNNIKLIHTLSVHGVDLIEPNKGGSTELIQQVFAAYLIERERERERLLLYSDQGEALGTADTQLATL